MTHDTREWEKEFDLLASELGLDGHQMDELRNLQRNQLQKAREDERAKILEGLSVVSFNGTTGYNPDDIRKRIAELNQDK